MVKAKLNPEKRATATVRGKKLSKVSGLEEKPATAKVLSCCTKLVDIMKEVSFFFLGLIFLVFLIVYLFGAGFKKIENDVVQPPVGTNLKTFGLIKEEEITLQRSVILSVVKAASKILQALKLTAGFFFDVNSPIDITFTDSSVEIAKLRTSEEQQMSRRHDLVKSSHKNTPQKVRRMLDRQNSKLIPDIIRGWNEAEWAFT